MDLTRSDELRARLRALVPGGAHTYAKGDDQYPEHAAPVIARGSGCHVVDVDGHEYIEYGMGLRSVTLGHAEPRVVAAAERAMRDGLNFTRPAAIELAAAEAVAEVIASAEMVKFAKNGSDVTTAAVKLARAFTGRDLVAIPAEAPFFSVDDWFIGSTPVFAGIPDAIRALTVRFHHDDLASVEALFADHPGAIACVVLDLGLATSGEFVAGVTRLCHAHGALLVIDEIITGFRFHIGGAQAIHGIKPDLSTFGKGLGNGFSIAALVGRRDVMELGGLEHERDRVFLLSTTYGAETTSLAAALEVIRIYRDEPVIEVLHRQGARLRSGVAEVARAHGLADRFVVVGRDSNLVYSARDQEGRPSQPFRTLVLQELIRRGVLAPSFVVSYAHSDDDIDRTIEAIDGMLGVYGRALEDGVEHHLDGRSVQPVMRQRN